MKIYFYGAINKERKGCCAYTIGYLDKIVTKVIPHFDKYKLFNILITHYLKR